MKNFILLITIIGLFACTNDSHRNSSKSFNNNIETIWIEVADKMSNFEALLSTNHLYYLKHMSIEHDNFKSGFWESIDTIQNNSWILTTVRKGAFENTFDKSQTQLCIEQQQHTINKNIGKVIKFNGNGSGYFATIEFIYDDSGKLIEYRDWNKTFFFKYNNKNILKELLRTEIIYGIKNNTGLIKFKKKT